MLVSATFLADRILK